MKGGLENLTYTGHRNKERQGPDTVLWMDDGTEDVWSGKSRNSAKGDQRYYGEPRLPLNWNDTRYIEEDISMP